MPRAEVYLRALPIRDSHKERLSGQLLLLLCLWCLCDTNGHLRSGQSALQALQLLLSSLPRERNRPDACSLPLVTTHDWLKQRHYVVQVPLCRARATDPKTLRMAPEHFCLRCRSNART